MPYSLNDPLRSLACSQSATHVLRGLLLPDSVKNGRLDPVRVGVEAQVPKHHRCCKNCPERVSLIFACDWRRGAMHGLEHRSFARMNVAARSHAQAALQACGEVRNDV